MGHFGKPQCDYMVILNIVKNPKVKNGSALKWDTSLSLSVTKLLLKAQSIILNAKGLVFYFYALRSGFNGDPRGIQFLFEDGNYSAEMTVHWYAVRPALQLA